MPELIHLFLASLFIIFFFVVGFNWYLNRNPYDKNIDEALEENAFNLAHCKDAGMRNKLLKERDYLLGLLDDKK